jgi:hypothetical protein
MKHFSKVAVTCGVLATAALFSVVPLRSQNPNSAAAIVVEQYRILPGRIPNTAQFKTDDQIERELNTLAGQGWKVRAANENAIILAR